MAPSDQPPQPPEDDAWASLDESDDWHGARERDRGRTRAPGARASKGSGLQLLMVAGPEIGRLFVLPRATLLVGRGKTNDLVLSDGSISREHARLEPRGDGVFVVDLNSGNGTFIDGERVSQASLRVGQQVAFGHVRLQLQTQGPVATATGSAPGRPTMATARASEMARARTASSPALLPTAAPPQGQPARSSAVKRRSRGRSWSYGLQVARAWIVALSPTLGRRSRIALAVSVAAGWLGMYVRHQTARSHAFASIQRGAEAFQEHRWDEAEQAFVTAEGYVPGYLLATRWQRMLLLARHDEEVLAQAKDALEKGDLLHSHALLMPLVQSPLAERTFALLKQWREAQHGRLLAAEAALQAHLPHEAQAMLEQIEAVKTPRPDRTSLLTWQRRLSELAALATRAAAWAKEPRKAVSLWEQAASQSPAMRSSLRTFKRLGAAEAPIAARKALGAPQTNDERKLLADLNEFEQLWDTAIEEHRGKRAFAAIKLFSQAKDLSARLVGPKSTLKRDLDAKLSDMYYVVGMQTLAAGKLPAAAEALRAALALTPTHALSLRRVQELEERISRMLDEADFVRTSRPARCKELLRQVISTMPASHPLGQRARKLSASVGR